jgi:hypothetical protein
VCRTTREQVVRCRSTALAGEWSWWLIALARAASAAGWCGAILCVGCCQHAAQAWLSKHECVGVGVLQVYRPALGVCKAVSLCLCCHHRCGGGCVGRGCTAPVLCALLQQRQLLLCVACNARSSGATTASSMAARSHGCRKPLPEVRARSCTATPRSRATAPACQRVCAHSPAAALPRPAPSRRCSTAAR